MPALRPTARLGRVALSLALALGLVAAAPGLPAPPGTSALLLAQSTRTITGRVIEAGAGAPVGNAQLGVDGTTLGARTADDGTFTLRGVPARGVTVSVRRIGYAPFSAAVPPTTDRLDVTLQRDVLKLDQVVVTGQASGISRRNLANAITSVSAEDLTKVPAPSLEQALQGKVSGAQIQSNTGAPGGGNRIRLRGISSITGASTPLYVIDGVIASDVAIAPGINRVTRASGTAISVASQENPVNRIADLNPNDIENIEVLKGAAAAAIYGSKASGGVIIVTTKRGRAGALRFNLRTGLGTNRFNTQARQGSRHFTNLDTATAVFGARTAEFFDPNRQINYEDLLYSEKPLNQETALSASGGTENTRVFISGLIRNEGGIVRNTYADKYAFRLNVDQRLGSRINASLGTEVLRTRADRGLFGNDNAGNSVAYTITKIPSFLDLRRNADGTFPTNPFYPSNPLQTVDLFRSGEFVWRNITNARIDADVYTSGRQQVRFIGNGGVDVFNQKNSVFSPPELQFEPNDGFPGTSAVSFGQNLNANVNLNAVHVYTPAGSLRATTQVGTQYELRDFDQTRTVAQNLLGGLANVTSGTVRDLSEERQRTLDFGVFAQTELLFAERLLLTAGLRADRSTNNGDPGKFYYFPKAATSYRFVRPAPGVVDELKLRAAYGETGNQPRYGQKFTTLTSANVGGVGTFQINTLRGATDIRPERQRESEVGIDAALFGNRATLELTGFNRAISDLIIQRTLAPTTGFAQQEYNAASMRVRGVEAAVGGALSLGPVQWTPRFNIATNRSRITKLPVPAFLLGTPQTGAVRIEEGKSATQLIGNDTLPQSPRVVVPVLMGDGNPSYTAGLSNELRLGGLSLYANLDRQKGGMLAAGTFRHYDLGQNSADYDEIGPDGKKLGPERVRTYLAVTRVYYQDASYVKLREVTLGYDIPQRLIRGALGRAESARLSLSGRNLYWWTKYRGGDPDYSNFGATPDAVQRNRELGSYPPSRSYWLTLDLGF